MWIEKNKRECVLCCAVLCCVVLCCVVLKFVWVYFCLCVCVTHYARLQKYSRPRRVEKLLGRSRPKPLARRASHHFDFCDDDFSEFLKEIKKTSKRKSGAVCNAKSSHENEARFRIRICLRCFSSTLAHWAKDSTALQFFVWKNVLLTV